MAKASGPIQFHSADISYRFPKPGILKAFLLSKLSNAGKAVEAINYIFCSDDYLLELNQTHLNHNTLTDIITFELSGMDEPLLADIYISIERVRENASSFSATFKSELLRVIFHGALHLLGYKDKSARDARVMRSMEDAWLAEFLNSY